MSSLNTGKGRCKGERTEEREESVGNEIAVFNRTGQEIMELEGSQETFDDSAVFEKVTDLIKRLNSVSDSNPMDSAGEGQVASNLLKIIVGKMAVMVGKLKGSETSQRELQERLHNLEMENIDLRAKLEYAEAHYQEQLGKMDLSIQLQYFQNELENELGRRIQAELELARLRSAGPQQIALENSQEEDPLLPSVDEGTFAVPAPPAPLPSGPPVIHPIVESGESFLNSRASESPTRRAISPPPPSLDHYPINTKKLMEFKARLELGQDFDSASDFDFPRPPARAYSSAASSVTGADSELEDFTNDDASSIFGGAPSIMSIDDEANDPTFSPTRPYRPLMRKSPRARKPTAAALAFKAANKRRESFLRRRATYDDRYASSMSPPSRDVSPPSSPIPSTSRQALAEMALMTPKEPVKSAKCPICKKGYVNKYHVDRHMRVAHDKSKKFVCSVLTCKQRFQRASLLNSHKRLEHSSSGRPHKCKICNKFYPNSNYLNKHMATHNPERKRAFVCAICSRAFYSERDLKQHHQVHRNKPWSCKYCDKNFTNEMSLKEHLTTHKSDKLKYHCTVCPQRFEKASDRKVHMRTHTGEKPFSCSVCKKTFSRKSHVDSHMLTHGAPRKYFCKFCIKGFVHKQACAKHEKVMHPERFGLPNERPFSCGDCNKNFKSASDLKSHSVVHSDEKPFVCDFCQKDFRRKSELTSHRRIHTGENPYKCPFCDKCFTSNTSMNVHKKLHSGRKDYQCRFCARKFAQASNCRYHEMRIHNSDRSRN